MHHSGRRSLCAYFPLLSFRFIQSSPMTTRVLHINCSSALFLFFPCLSQASPAEVKMLLIDRPETADSSLLSRFLLSKLDEDCSLQFVTFSSPPDKRHATPAEGLVDYLLVCGEEPYGTRETADQPIDPCQRPASCFTYSCLRTFSWGFH